MLDNQIVDAALQLVTTGAGGHRLLPANQEKLCERLLADPMLVEATRALYLLALRLRKRGHPAAAEDVIAVARRAHDRLAEHVEAATQRHRRMLHDFSRVCDRETTWRAPVWGVAPAADDQSFRIRSLPRAKLR